MRKAYALVEMLVMIVVVSALFIPIGHLTKATLYQIPIAYKDIQVNTSILDFLRQLEADINSAASLPDSIGSHKTDQNNLLIRQPDKNVCYQLKKDKIVKIIFQSDASRQETASEWPATNARIKWKILTDDDLPYALEVTTNIERKSGEKTYKKMANSHIFFVNAHQEAIDK
ncbi:MAG: hypothetical protein H8D47_00685 [Planctomycetes bacterium]|nr:hypothetical protein [Planctomycetota bacterium]MBL7107383.1 hypothetical protein [Phycisphaerae bacterium]